MVLASGFAARNEKVFDPAHNHSSIVGAVPPNITAHIRAIGYPDIAVLFCPIPTTKPPRRQMKRA
jgi:hypothetical protein